MNIPATRAGSFERKIYDEDQFEIWAETGILSARATGKTKISLGALSIDPDKPCKICKLGCTANDDPKSFENCIEGCNNVCF